MTGLLYNRSCYSLLSSTITIDKLVSFAVEQGYEAIALTDQNVLFGAMEFYHKCTARNIKPVFGLEVQAYDSLDSYTYLLYARNEAGYQELIKISSRLNCGSNEQLSVAEVLAFKNVIIVENALNGYLSQADDNKAEAIISVYRDKHVFVGVPGNDSEYNRNFNSRLFSRFNNRIDFVALSLAVYSKPDEFDAYKILMCIKQSRNITDPSLKFEAGKAYLYTKEELKNYYSETVLYNTDLILRECNCDLLKLPKAELPLFKVPQGTDRKTYLTALCHAGLKKRFEGQQAPDSYSKRLEYELKIICSMNFENYFLIVWDIILYSRRHGINVGVGRGSAAGSLVAYCLGITHIDPLKYGLLFERFLNPERISMPDIDIDFPDDRREEVIDYVEKTYGHDNVAHIIAFGTLGARQVLKDTGKALQINSSAVDILTRTLGNDPKIALKTAYERNDRFRTAVNSSKDNQRLYQTALRLEGLPRHTTTHAAGIVITENNLMNNMPLISFGDSLYSTQYSMSYLEELGLIKIDFLGLRNLTIIAEISDHIRTKEPFDILKIPLTDSKTYELISRGDTSGVFQLESEGMKNLMRRLKPHKFEDLAVAIALYRPGPMENIPTYLAARANSSNVTYIHENLKPILESTYGVMIFQEQIMQIARTVAGFSLGKADILRKSISKKNESGMLEIQNEFISGAVKRGYSEKTAEDIFASIRKFASYGFNKSHSVAYAMVAYQLAYLKANYPLAFYLSLLNSVIGAENKTNEYFIELRKSGHKILQPDVNKSEAEYVVEGNNLRFPLNGIKGLGRVNVTLLLDERKANGPFHDYIEFVVRMSIAGMSQSVIETMIKAGALDSFNMTRTTMLNALEEVIRYGDLIKINKDGQVTFDITLVSRPMIKYYDDNRAENEKAEHALVGVYFREHPVEALRPRFPQAIPVNQAKLVNRDVTVLVRIQRVKEHRTRNGELMCFIDAYDEYDSINLVVMPNIYRMYSNSLNKDKIILVSGIYNETGSVKVANITLV